MMKEHQELMEYLQKTGDTSLQIRIESTFVKTLLLSAASYFETKMTNGVVQVFQDRTNDSEILVSFVRNVAVERQYHRWFNWKASNANQFFGAFGATFRDFMEEKVRSNPALADSIKAFLELGSLRNQLVHQNFAQFSIDKTVAEIFEQYEKANKFVEGFLGEIKQYLIDEHKTV